MASVTRKTYDLAFKKMLLAMMDVPTESGSPMSINAISKLYGVPRKTLYEWRDNYEKFEEEGLKPHRPSQYKKSYSNEVIQHIKEIALYNPGYGAHRISKLLNKYNVRKRAPTIQGILREMNLGLKEERFSATERALLNMEIKLSPKQTERIVKFNPCYADTLITAQYRKHGIYVDAIPIQQYFKSGPLYILVAVELSSLYTIAKVCASDPFEAFCFKSSVATCWIVKKGFEKVRIFDDGRRPFDKQYPFYTNSDIDFLPFPMSKSGSKTAGAFQVVAKKLKIEFIPKAKSNNLSSVEELNKALQAWAENFNQIPGPKVFPCFSKTPCEALGIQN